MAAYLHRRGIYRQRKKGDRQHARENSGVRGARQESGDRGLLHRTAIGFTFKSMT